MSVLPVGIGSSGGYTISRSVRLRSSASAYLSETFGTPTNNKIWTWSGWVKRSNIGSNGQLFAHYTSDTQNNYFQFSGDVLRFSFDNGTVYAIATSAVFRDPSAWYHVVIAVDTTQATAANRTKLYVNGVEQTVTGSYVPQNTNTYLNGSGRGVTIGRRSAAADQYLDGYLTEINFIDGQALTPSSFGETDTITGVWKPKKYTGTYGTNGFYLNFSDNSATTATTIGKDNSGNGNNWTPNNISITAGATYDSMLDVPTPYDDGGNGRGNYATWNPLFIPATNSKAVLTNGNLTATATATASFFAISSIGVKSGKWYCEFTLGANSAVNAYPYFGVEAFSTMTTGSAPGGSANGVAYNQSGQKYTNNTASSYGTAWSNGDVIGLAFDLDSAQRTATFYRNGTSQGSINFNTTTEEMVVGLGLNGSGETGSINFGQRPFSYTPPTGFVALNTQNLPDATIKKGGQYFDATTFTATGTTQAVTNSGFQPDLLWFKRRDTVNNHFMFNSVVGDNNYLVPNLTDAEATSAAFISSLNSNGFTMGTGNYANTSSVVCWNWKESVTAGFDIVTYTGTGANRTVAHSLGVAPSMVIVKDRTTAGNWPVYHVSIGATNAIYLNLTNASGATSTAWNNTAPTSSVFSLGTSTLLNGSGDNYVAYLFAEVAGFSKFGSYTGNGSADGPFIYCGFRPKFVLYKRTNAVSNWFIDDSSRSGYNVITSDLLAEATNVEASYNGGIDFLSNGFKQKATANGNASGGTYIFMAFAENPFKHSLAR